MQQRQDIFMSDIVITREDGPRAGRYVARIAGIDAEGEITYTHKGPGVISANHTGVPDAMGGRGVAKALLDFMLEDARTNGFRIVPVCPYVRGQYAKLPNGLTCSRQSPARNRRV
jgi:uncharacterized protein